MGPCSFHILFINDIFDLKKEWHSNLILYPDSVLLSTTSDSISEAVNITPRTPSAHHCLAWLYFPSSHSLILTFAHFLSLSSLLCTICVVLLPSHFVWTAPCLLCRYQDQNLAKKSKSYDTRLINFQHFILVCTSFRHKVRWCCSFLHSVNHQSTELAHIENISAIIWFPHSNWLHVIT